MDYCASKEVIDSILTSVRATGKPFCYVWLSHFSSCTAWTWHMTGEGERWGVLVAVCEDVRWVCEGVRWDMWYKEEVNVYTKLNLDSKYICAYKIT